MPKELMPSDYETIYLQPDCCATTMEGRLWCDTDVFSGGCENECKATKYTRSDLANPAPREVTVDMQKVKQVLVMLFPFDGMEHSQAQETMELLETMGLVELRDTETDFEKEEYGETVWELTAEANNLRITKEK